MKNSCENKSILKRLENLELAGITFIRDYIQFLFDGPILNTYTLPQVKINNEITMPTDFGYCDILCHIINKKIYSAYEDEPESKIVIKFEGDIELFVFLDSEDQNCPEVAMIQFENGEWNVW